MPTYDYRCKACSHEFELFQSMKDSPKRKCPECGKNALERLIGTGAALLFKGSGFYETDYRSDSYKKAKEAESKSSSGESKSESKSETKSDSKSSESGKSESKPAKTETAKPAKADKPAAKKASKKTA